MPRSVAIVIALLFACEAGAQDTLPARFAPLAKNERFRLVRVLGMPEVHPALGQTAALSSDGKYALYTEDMSSGSEEMPRLRTRLLFWDLQTKAWPREFELEGKSVTALDLSRDGSKVLIAGQFFPPSKEKVPTPRAFLLLFDLRAGKVIHTIETKDSVFLCVALAPDEGFALTGSLDKLKQWNLKNAKDVVVYDAKVKDPVAALAYLPGGKQFLAGYHGSGVRLWSVGQDKPVRTYALKGAPGAVLHLAVSRDGKRFAADDLLAWVHLWETDTGKQIGKLPGDKRPDDEFLAGLVFADDGKTVVTAWSKRDPAPDDFAGATVLAWDADKSKTLWSQPASYRGRVPLLVQNDLLTIGGGANTFDTWNIKTGKRDASWGGHKGPVTALATLADGDIVSAGHEGVIMTWRKGVLAQKHAAHKGAVTAVALNKVRTQWLTAGADLQIHNFPPDASRTPVFQKKHTGPITSLAFSAKGNWAASGSADRSVKTWFVPTGAEIDSLTGHSEGVNAVAITPDATVIASGSDDTTIRLWPVKAGKHDADRETNTLEGHKKPVTCLAFAADGKTLLSGSQDQTLKVWDSATGKCVRTIPGHKNWITSILILDAKTALTTSDDLTICLWDLDAGKEIARLDFGAVGDCPRCVTRLGEDRLLVGTSSWLIYELQMLPAAKTGKGPGSSK